MIKARISKIRKRDGRIVDFDASKISNAMRKAFIAVGQGDGELAEKLTGQVVEILEKGFPGDSIPSVEDVQDIVERVLIENRLADVAKAYILYREKRSEIRRAKSLLGVVDDLKLGVNATTVLRNRYLLKDREGNIIETPSQLFRRVAKAVAEADIHYDRGADIPSLEETFYGRMVAQEFLPNSPTLMNAGTRLGQLSACFVLPVEDSLLSIFEGVKNMALIHQSGGGTGFSFSRLRPKGDMVGSTMGVASGPISFMRVFDTATDVIKQGGRRRGANMGILRVDHPDILEFIAAKEREGFLTNFNLSVAVTDAFMEAVERDDTYELINPHTEDVAGRLRAKAVFDLIATSAWKTGDPGLIFLDEINRHNPTPQLGEIESTNPCGEQPLLPYESCNLGSINLSKMVGDGDVDWEKFSHVIKDAVHFLDNVIDVNRFPLPQIERITKGNRKIGLGVMGFADLLAKLEIPYDSEEALQLGEKIAGFLSDEAVRCSVELAEERGSFPNFPGSLWEERGFKGIRNATLTTIAPTGTLSIIAECSSGIEPLFAISFIRNVMGGTRLLEVNTVFERVAKERGFYSNDLMVKIAKTGSIQGIDDIPEDVKRVFVTALDISPEWHVRMQAAFQKYIHNAVSKTVNLPKEATIEDVKNIYLLAYKLKCKGITIYRYGSKREQVLYVGREPTWPSLEESYTRAESEYSGGCPTPQCLYA